MQDELLTPMQAAKFLGVCKLTILKKIQAGKIKAIKDGSYMRIRKSDLEVYLQAHSNIN